MVLVDTVLMYTFLYYDMGNDFLFFLLFFFFFCFVVQISLVQKSFDP